MKKLDTRQPSDPNKWDNRPYARITEVDGERVTARAKPNQSTHIFREDKLKPSNEDVYPLSTPEILTKPVVRDPDATAKCCRGAFQMDDEMIATIFRVHGLGIKTYVASQPSDAVEVWENGAMVTKIIPADQLFGWDMTKPQDGYPCIALLPNGKCKYQNQKPRRCMAYPTFPIELRQIEGCGYTFDEFGNRTGECHGCGSLE